MLNATIAFCLRNRLLVAVSALLVAAVGTSMALELPIDVLPDLNRPTVTIMTEAHGFTPEEVELRITRPIEYAVNGSTGVTRVRSQSQMGLSLVWVEFDWDTEIYRNRQIVQEKLQVAAETLPDGITPHMAPVTSLLGQVQMIGLRSKRAKEEDPTRLRSLAVQQLRPRLMTVEGVANVIASGGSPRQLQALLQSDLLRAEGVALSEVARAIHDANVAGSGGLQPMGAQSPLISVPGRAARPEDIATAVVRDDPLRPVRVEDLGEVRFGPSAFRVGEAGVNGGPGVVLVILKQPGVDTVKLTEAVDAELVRIRDGLPDDVELLPGLWRQSDFIHRAIDNVTEAVRDGAILVVIVLFVFLLNFRTTIITLTAIPLSIAATALCFKLTGVSINTMTLGGLAVAIGALVDDAIVDVENVFRRLRQARLAEKRVNPLVTVFKASSEVRGPILIGTLVVATVYLPLFALSGMEGRLFQPIGVAYIVSILASLIVALTVTPVLCVWLLPKAKSISRQEDGWLVRRLKNGAERLIRVSIRHPIPIAGTLSGLVVAGMIMLASLGTEFLPPFNEGSAQVNLILPPDTGIDTSDAYGRRLETVVGSVDGVARVARRTGRAEGDEHVMGVNVTEMIVAFDPSSKRTREDVIGDIRGKVDSAFPGVPTETEQPLAHLLSHLLSGVNAQVAIKIFGPNLEALRNLAQDVRVAIQDIDGVADLMVEPQVLVRQILVRPKRAELARWGLRVGDVTETIELALEGEAVSQYTVGQWVYPIVVRLAPSDRGSLASIEDILMQAPTGELLRLADVAAVEVVRAPNQISREHVARRIVVQHNVEGRSLGEVVEDVNRALDSVREILPTGYSIQISGQFEAQEEASRTIFALSLVSLLIMFVILFTHFRSANLAIQTLLNIPAAFIGAVAFLLLTSQTLSVATLVGFVALGGIASRNGILLLDHYLHLMKEEDLPFHPDTLVRAGRERVVPVLMTALTSGVALIPILLSPGAPGRELLYPVASVIVGGLVSTTLLDLLLTPGVFWIFGRKAAEAHIQRDDPGDLVSNRLARSLAREPTPEMLS